MATTTTDSNPSFANLYGRNVTGATAEYDSTIQTATDGYDEYMRRNTKNYDELSYFLSGIDVTDQNLDQMTPYIPGLSRLYFHKTPYFMQKQFPKMTDNFRSYFETGFKSVDGINDIDVDFADYEGGWAGQKFSNVSMARDNTDTITVSLYELTGSPVREFIETWVTVHVILVLVLRTIMVQLQHQKIKMVLHTLKRTTLASSFTYASILLLITLSMLVCWLMYSPQRFLRAISIILPVTVPKYLLISSSRLLSMSLSTSMQLPVGISLMIPSSITTSTSTLVRRLRLGLVVLLIRRLVTHSLNRAHDQINDILIATDNKKPQYLKGIGV